MNFLQEDIKQAEQIIKQFKKKKTNEEIFYNLCFCVLVPQAKFSGVLKVVERLKQRNFYSNDIPKIELPEIIKESRFKNRKSIYLLELKTKFIEVLKKLKSERDSREVRKWLVGNIKGISFKASSHFLRNLGIDNLAIIDTHILKFLSLTKEEAFYSHNYFELEEILQKTADKLNISLAVLDAVIWKNYSGTEWKDFVY